MSLFLRPPCILGVGKNYQDHIDELKGDRPQYPVVFFKNPASVISNGMAIEIPPIARTPELGVDYEGELAIVLAVMPWMFQSLMPAALFLMLLSLMM